MALFLTTENIDHVIISRILQKHEGYNDLLNIDPDFFESPELQTFYREHIQTEAFESPQDLSLELMKSGIKNTEIKKIEQDYSSFFPDNVLLFYKNTYANRLIRMKVDVIRNEEDYEEQLRMISELEEKITDMSIMKAKITSTSDSLKLYREKLLQTQEEAKNNDGVIGLDTGLASLNAAIYGIGKQDYMVIAGRPSMGKTSMVIKMFLASLHDDKVSVFVSLETALEDLIARIIPQVNDDLDLKHTLFGQDPEFAQPLIDEVLAYLETKKMYIIDFHEDSDAEALNPTPMQVAKKLAEIEKKEGRIDLVIWDHIGLLGASNPKLIKETEVVTSISREIKLLIRAFSCPHIVLSQLNRGLENRVDKRPKMSDLRSSGAIEQDADKILFVYRHSVYLEQALKEKLQFKSEPAIEHQLAIILNREADEAEIIIAKNRNGPKTTVNTFFVKKKACFTDNYFQEDIPLTEIYGDGRVYEQTVVD